MNVKYVYGVFQNICGLDILKIKELALKNGYEFFLPNDYIYHIGEDGWAHKTCIRKADLYTLEYIPIQDIKVFN